MVTDQNHSSDISSEQKVIRYMKILAQAFGLDKQNAETLEKRVKGLERDVEFLETELEDLDDSVDECVNRKTILDLIHKIVPTLVSEKGQKKNKDSSYSSESYEESDLGEIDEESHGYQVREERAVPHAFAPLARQRRRTRPIKSTSSKTSSSESSSSESSSSSETSSSETSSSESSSSEDSSFETSSSESSSSDSNIDEIVNMIKYQRIWERLA
ncbi:hypothetical protein C1646_777590 [Rhizophagus diaphanus]|nr:hypothetical protein C1646_777590 [Rhizophagus diaphanus] [Rhizophagus sp. MUCL 43196]